jgi:hypothetical protein
VETAQIANAGHGLPFERLAEVVSAFLRDLALGAATGLAADREVRTQGGPQ